MKIAFCFLIKENIYHVNLWKHFFENTNNNNYKIYIHSKNTSNCDFVNKYLIKENVPTEWGKDLYSAIKLLYKNAYNDDNSKYILLSESTIPLRSFDYVYARLSKYPKKSSLNYLPQIPTNSCQRHTFNSSIQRFVNNSKRCKKFSYNINICHWYYADMWTILTKSHVKILLDDEKIINYFENAFAWDENYPMYILSISNEIKNIKKERNTFVNWDEPVYFNEFSKSPKLYNDVTIKILKNMIQEKSILFARKFSIDSNVSNIIIKLNFLNNDHNLK